MIFLFANMFSCHTCFIDICASLFNSSSLDLAHDLDGF